MKVFFIDKVHPVLQERLNRNGFDCIDATSFSQDDLLKFAQDVQGIVIRARFYLSAEYLSNFPNLSFIARSGSGLENIDAAYCRTHHIQLFNSPEGNRNAVAEHALGMLLALMNKLCKANEQINRGIWKREENRGEELDGKTVGIIGYGNNGAAFAKKLRGFDVKVLAYDKFKQGFGDAFVQESTLEAIFNTADVLSLHIPQNKETVGLVNEDFINSFKKPFYLLNLSRGKIVHTESLIKAIESKKIKAAGLDVLEYESKDFESIFANQLPTAFKYLLASDRVLLSPHVGGWTKESYFKLSDVLADKIIAYYQH
ncbi:MAG: NAD(P)-dependent oxidoreductase [Flavobacteriales bacterium]